MDVRKLPIGPEEAYLLSRVDGRTSESDLATLTGLDATAVESTFGRLRQLGAIQYAGEPPPAAAPPPAERRPSGAVRITRPVVESRPPAGTSEHPGALAYDPRDLDEECDLDLERKRRILDTFHRLDALSHYELLRIPPGADKKEVKAAYFEVVAIFHPDKYFGKTLGSYKPKLEKIFQRLTQAHDVLSRRQTRDEYDQYLGRLRRTRELDRMLDQDAAAEIERVQRRIEEAARAERAESAPPGAAAAAPGRSTPPSGPVSSPEARRRALARKLTGPGPSEPPGPRAPSAPPRAPTPPPGAVKAAVADDLKRRYETRVAQARSDQIRHYVEAADQASADDDPVSAANALRIAATLAPDDAALQDRLAHAQAQAASELADTHARNAAYEERSGQLAEAARSWERAIRGNPKPEWLERAAGCLLESGGDLKQAADFARRAVAASPDRASKRLLLGRVYLRAGMLQSAIAEIERAAALDPADANIQIWLKKARRGDTQP